MKTLESAHILAKIVKAKMARLDAARLRVPEAVVKKMAEMAPAVPSFRHALEDSAGIRIIAEIKKASPSRGVLAPGLNPPALSRTYKDAGAVAVSVVTEEDFFQGSLAWIRSAGVGSALPVLRKDFIFDSYQVYESRAAGASAILLIAAMLTPDEVNRLLDRANQANLDVLVEVHTLEELGQAVEAGAHLIGVNNRDLRTFEVDIETSLKLAEYIPEDALFVAESGIRERSDINRLRAAGADAFLVGEHFVTAESPGAALRALL